jgi:uncharacterized protein (TIGR02266 family)
MVNKRKTIRIDEQLRVTYKVVCPPDGHGGGVSHNISEGGICIPTQQRLQTGMILELSIHLLDDAKPITATGELIWLEERKDARFPYAMGIRFINIDPTERDKVFKYVKKKASRNRRDGLAWIE